MLCLNRVHTGWVACSECWNLLVSLTVPEECWKPDQWSLPVGLVWVGKNAKGGDKFLSSPTPLLPPLITGNCASHFSGVTWIRPWKNFTLVMVLWFIIVSCGALDVGFLFGHSSDWKRILCLGPKELCLIFSGEIYSISAIISYMLVPYLYSKLSIVEHFKRFSPRGLSGTI